MKTSTTFGLCMVLTLLTAWPAHSHGQAARTTDGMQARELHWDCARRGPPTMREMREQLDMLNFGQAYHARENLYFRLRIACRRALATHDADIAKLAANR
jgi:hypothetical protein